MPARLSHPILFSKSGKILRHPPRNKKILLFISPPTPVLSTKKKTEYRQNIKKNVLKNEMIVIDPYEIEN